MREPGGREALRRYYDGFIEIAGAHDTGFTFDTPTWRASNGWGEKLGFSPQEIADINREAVEFGAQARADHEGSGIPIAICGAIGPEGDAYHPEKALSAGEAEEYHSVQVGVLAAEGVDMVGAYTLTYVEEAIGIARAAAAAGMPGLDLLHGRDRRPAAERRAAPQRRWNGSTPRPRRSPPT